MSKLGVQKYCYKLVEKLFNCVPVGKHFYDMNGAGYKHSWNSHGDLKSTKAFKLGSEDRSPFCTYPIRLK